MESNTTVLLDVDSDWIEKASSPLLILSCMGTLSSFFFQRVDSSLKVRCLYVFGFILSINFVVFWAGPIAIQGVFFKEVLAPYFRPVYNVLDKSIALRSFATNYVYRDEKHVDYFATQVFFTLGFMANMGLVLYWQITYHHLPWWLIAVYNFQWVGFGGRAMGAAYVFAHREGHNTMIYAKWIRYFLGNVFENWIGLFYGGVPYNFSTTHNSLHHRLDASVGDTLYCWDLERSSWTDFTFYASRGCFHMSGFAAMRQFLQSKRKIDRNYYLPRLVKGLVLYWVVWPAVVLYSFRSVTFYFFIILQPFLCMTFFINLINWGFHAFLDDHESPTVESVTLVGSDDDYFGEDDHMAHHLYPSVFYTELEEHQKHQHAKWSLAKASVFQGPDAASFGLLVLCKGWAVLGKRYVDYSQSMKPSEIEAMLEIRTKRVELPLESLLPDLDQKVNARKVEPEKDSGFVYELTIEKLGQLQFFIAQQIETSLPPIKAMSME